MGVITVSNKSNVPRTEILCINESSHKFSKNESMKEWVAAGNNPENWNRLVTQVYVTDKTKAELEYLLEPLVTYVTNPPQIIGKKYHFTEPDPAHPIWQEMYHTGEVHVDFETLKPFIIERK